MESAPTGDSALELVRVEDDAERAELRGDLRAELRALLGEFHTWMASHEPRYDPGEEHEFDARTLTTATECVAWLARVAGDPAGCVLLYRGTADLAEFRRLWVRPEHRRAGVGRALLRTVIESARQAGVETLALTTPPWGTAGHELYESMGFERTPPYPETRLDEQFHDEAIFMQLDLRAAEEEQHPG